MKKIITVLFILVFISYPLFSQSLVLPTSSSTPNLLTEKISIGTSQIANKIFIVDNAGTSSSTIDERFFIRLHNTDNTASSGVTQEMLSGNSGAKMEIGQFGSNYGTGSLFTTYANRGTIIARGGSGLIIRSSPDPSGFFVYDGITFQTGSNTPERMRITGTGFVGIGTKNPNSKLQVTDGDVYIDNPYRGIILKSPSGNCFRTTVDDFGNLIRSQIICP